MTGVKTYTKSELSDKIELSWLALYDAIDSRDLKAVFRLAFMIQNYRKKLDITF